MNKTTINIIVRTIKIAAIAGIIAVSVSGVAFAQLASLPIYLLQSDSITQNQDRTWNVGYTIPRNTVVDGFSLIIDSNPPVLNPQAAYGGMRFKVPAAYLKSGSVQSLTLKNSSGVSVSRRSLTIPSGVGPQYVLQSSLIKLDTAAKQWDIPYRVPQNTIAGNYELIIGSKSGISGARIVNDLLVFRVPETSFDGSMVGSLVLRNTKTGDRYDSNGWVTQGTADPDEAPGFVPAAPAEKITLDVPGIAKTQEGEWKIPYRVPPNTVTGDHVLAIGDKGEVGNAKIINDRMVFTVPGAGYQPADQNRLVLRNVKTGVLYAPDGTQTQGVANAPEDDTSKYIGGLLVTFPKDGQNIQQTSAVIKVSFRALLDLPRVDTSYVWNRSSDPASSIEKTLVVLPGPLEMKAGAEFQGTMRFTGLTPGATYTFVLKNNLTQTVSEPVQFTTPTTAGQKAYVSYEGGADGFTGDGYDAPTGGLLEDTISDKGIVPRCGRTPGPNVPDEETVPCGYAEFMKLIGNVIKYALIIFGPIVAGILIYSGAQIMIYGKINDPTSEQSAIVKNAKARLIRIAVGILIILSGWVLVATITRELGVKEGYTLLDLFTGN